ncbi:MAG: hypothetical protein NC124_08575 [Clostridium sp.]|nr:hypothetical protein [Clostridium sp.]
MKEKSNPEEIKRTAAGMLAVTGNQVQTAKIVRILINALGFWKVNANNISFFEDISRSLSL